MQIMGCSRREEAILRAALQVAGSKLVSGVCGFGGLEQLRGCLLDSLAGRRPLNIRCRNCIGGLSGYTLERGFGDIVFCRDLFRETQARINAVVFHELIHACGGFEMDSEAFENQCFRGAGATPPTSGDYVQFRRPSERNGYYEGAFLFWDPRTGRFFVRGPGGVTQGPPLDVRYPAPRDDDFD